MKKAFLYGCCFLLVSCATRTEVNKTTIQTVEKKVTVIQEKKVTIPICIDNADYTLEAKMYYPDDGKANHPIAIVTHGRKGSNPDRNPNQVNGLAPLNRALAYQGYVSLYVVRRGYGKSDGPDSEYLDTPEESGLAAAQDIKGVVEYLHMANIGDSSKIVVIGQSQGGWVSLAASTINMPGVLGTVNISGAINFKQARGYIKWSGVEKPLERSAGYFGNGNKEPVLWLYAENDNHSVKSVKKWFGAFVGNGGRGKLYFIPKYKPVFYMNGHGVVNRPDYYFRELLEYFNEIGFSE